MEHYCLLFFSTCSANDLRITRRADVAAADAAAVAAAVAASAVDEIAPTVDTIVHTNNVRANFHCSNVPLLLLSIMVVVVVVVASFSMIVGVCGF